VVVFVWRRKNMDEWFGLGKDWFIPTHLHWWYLIDCLRNLSWLTESYKWLISDGWLDWFPLRFKDFPGTYIREINQSRYEMLSTATSKRSSTRKC
jgi:hypothetical protein